jgi:hypothetical protein
MLTLGPLEMTASFMVDALRDGLSCEVMDESLLVAEERREVMAYIGQFCPSWRLSYGYFRELPLGREGDIAIGIVVCSAPPRMKTSSSLPRSAARSFQICLWLAHGSSI